MALLQDAAKALYEQSRGVAVLHGAWEDAPSDVRTEFRNRARAVLDACRSEIEANAITKIAALFWEKPDDETFTAGDIAYVLFQVVAKIREEAHDD